MNLTKETMEAFRARLSALPEDDPLLLGIVTLIVRVEDDATQAVAMPNATPDQRTYNAGRIAAAMDIREVLQVEWAESRKPKPDVKPPK